MMNLVLAILAIVLTLLLVVGIHEAGHALAARFFQVKIRRFSIGFGKPVLRFQKKSGIEWVLGRWPLGGYVLLLNSRIEPVCEKDYPGCFDKKPPGVRTVILLAGAVINFLTAWLLLILVFSIGLYEITPEIKEVIPNSLAANADIKASDRIIAVADHDTPDWREINMQLLMALGKPSVAIRLKNQAGEMYTAYLDLQKKGYSNKRQPFLDNLGLVPLLSTAPVKVQAASLGDAILRANHHIVDTLIFMTVILKQVLTGKIAFSMLLGPLSMLAITAGSLLQGMVMFLFFIAGFSIAVGFVNLFPIPGLDGGSILYACIEKIRGKPVDLAWEVLLYRLAMIAMLVLLANLIGNDLQSFA